MSQFPKVTIAHIGDIGAQQSYENLEIIQGPEGISVTSFFNDIYKKSSSDIYLFLADGYECIHENVVQRIVDTLNYNKWYAGIYSDVILEKDNITRKLYMLGFDKTLISRYPINSPIACTKQCCPIFDTRIQYLYYAQALLTVSHRFMFYHIADFLFKSKIANISPQILKNDTEILKSYEA